MAAPVIPPYTGDVPQRTQSPAVFSVNVDGFLTYIPPTVDAMNVSTDFVNTKADETSSNAVIAQVAADTSAAASNFKGRWADATGAATVPSSYNHNNADWQLLQNIPDITLDEPSNSAPNWQQISYRELYADDFPYLKDTRVVGLVDNRTYISTVDSNLGNEPSVNIGTFWILDDAILSWGVGRAYGVGEQAYSTVDGRRYVSQTAVNLGNEPSVNDGANWLTEYGKVTTPTITSPTASETGVQLKPTLTASAYVITGSDSPQEWANWQIATDAGFTNIVYDSGFVTGNTHKIRELLDPLTTYHVQVAYKGVRTDVTPYSTAVEFTTSIALSDYFSINNETGNGVALTVTTGLDLSTNDGTIWIANRDNAEDGKKYTTTEALLGEDIFTDGALVADPDALTAYTTTGFDVGADTQVNAVGDAITAYSFRDRQGFHDTVKWSGAAATVRSIPHNINGTVGMTIVRGQNSGSGIFTDSTWIKHINIGGSTIRRMNNTGSSSSGIDPTDDNNINLVSAGFNFLGSDYVAELFAHNPDAGIFCSLYTGNGGTQKITTGFPVGLLIAPTNAGTKFADIENGTGSHLDANVNGMTQIAGGITSFDSDGITVSGLLNTNGQVYYYVAIADPKQF